MALNTGQVVSGMGSAAQGARDMEDTLLDLQKKQLIQEEQNRLASEEYRQLAMGIRKPVAGEVDIPNIRDIPKYEVEPDKKPGLAPSSTVTTPTPTPTPTETPTETAGRTGLKVKEMAGKETTKDSKLVLPEELQVREKFTYPIDRPFREQGEEESDFGYKFRKISASIADIFPWAFSLEESMYDMDMANFAPVMKNFFGLQTPAERKEMGFTSKKEADDFFDMATDYDSTVKVATWFADRPGASDVYRELPLGKQIQTVKYILGQEGGIEKDSGLTKEETKTANTTSKQVTKVREQAGLNGPSSIEANPPSKKWTESLIANPGTARTAWKDAVEEHNNAVLRYQMAQWVGPSRLEEAKLAEQDVIGWKAQIKLTKGMQAIEDFNGGDPRLLESVMSDEFGKRITFDNVGPDKWNVLQTDANGNTTVRRGHEGIATDDVTSGAKMVFDSTYVQEYREMLKEIAKETRKFQTDVALKEVDYRLELAKLVKGKELDAQIATIEATGGKIEKGIGRDGKDTIIWLKPDGTSWEFVPPKKMKNGKYSESDWSRVG